jgi:hypothetical protein
MDQSVMTFADSTARGSAIGTASAQEGMLTYLEDTDAFEYWDGSAFTAFGGGGGAATNAVINGAFEINQRNFSSSTAAGYGFDRWQTNRSGGTSTASSQAFTLGTAPVTGFEASNFQRIVTSGLSASGDFSVLLQPIESVRTFANQTVTVSFYAKAGSGTPQIGVEFEQEFGTGGSPSSAVSTPVAAKTISTSWTRYTATVLVPSIAGKTLGTNNNNALNVLFWVSAGSTLNSRASSIGIQNNTFDIWGVQVEAGSEATAFRRNANSLQGELAACQRYYWRSTPGTAYGTHGQGSCFNTTTANIRIINPVPMRTNPGVVEFANVQAVDSSFSGSFTNLGLSASEQTLFVTSIDVSGSGFTANRPASFRNANNAAGFIGFSAEL